MFNSINLPHISRNLLSNSSTCLTVGNFDGVHLGHQSILKLVSQSAITKELVPSVLTFEPHPREYFGVTGNRPELIPTKIQGLRDKVLSLGRCGISEIFIQRFNKTTASMLPEDFITSILVKGLKVKSLFVGADFRFGYKRKGDSEMLKSASKKFGFDVNFIDDILDTNQIRYSSSELRNALAYGNISQASQIMGRNYHFTGRVIHGKKLGAKIGTPTMNMRVPQRFALRSGIYIVTVSGLSAEPLQAVANLGIRPTVESSGEVLLEVHILDRIISAYGKIINVSFLDFIRDEEKFPSVEAMAIAIQKDIEKAKNYFKKHGI
ncbi:bifunctional riboflavin kinase/FAD synthetase [Taylorella equigenitalis]|uniref:Riboflavin biosynthesis protein n=2 Tax=Taylorella equigenitalis TaxID=29575 RepID=I7IBH3_9BURK|nr:bifunctional riboflavin kinase/FAD synthetase [Taylorella equigenitalis]AFN36114.1 riboflavin biosynthesis protein [Taylorella equigenitalis ATCC 35865]ASY39526.1 bifunctional riboflavin kinase/FMN adenylyltransferase [Taylorella equigenitalis]WDU51358.1 bifunctional riboflavin kinase/FAD synthetase [Taylorella equigenitalis]WDU52920.1 bifunctional riboflavin kinase/FAD synthetase [Taylorella equigenitalis]WDU54379.1 bifunctional riboflavin kinase/FAD synthetase [Taylorella equigenitalis]